GEFNPIPTNVPGIQICEVFPRLARLMDKAVVIRSLIGATGGHDAIQCMSGWRPDSLRNLGGRPSIGAAAARLQGPVDPSVPAFVGLAARTQHVPWSDSGTAGFLGPAFGPFKPEGAGMANFRLNGITVEQLADRRRLLGSFNSLRREIDANGALEGVDSATRRALGVLTSSRLLDALDISQEPQRIRDRY